MNESVADEFEARANLGKWEATTSLARKIRNLEDERNFLRSTLDELTSIIDDARDWKP